MRTKSFCGLALGIAEDGFQPLTDLLFPVRHIGQIGTADKGKGFFEKRVNGEVLRSVCQCIYNHTSFIYPVIYLVEVDKLKD